MKNVTIATAILATLFAGNVAAQTYTKSAGTSWGTSSSQTQTHNVTVRTGKSVTETQDYVAGGFAPDGTRCDPVTCQAEDADLHTTQRDVVKTNLVITNTGNSTTTGSSFDCFSSVSGNGLSMSQGWSVSDFATAGSSTVSVAGTITSKSVTESTTTNDGNQIGSSKDVVKDVTTIDEVTTTTYTRGGETITFTSSIGR